MTHDAQPEPFDAVIIGAGQAGPPLARALADAGRRVLIVEREHVGGTCINEGCTPTKTMLASATTAETARRGQAFGVHAGPVSVDMTRVRQRKREIVDSWRESGEKGLRDHEGVTLLMGEARFTGPRELEVREGDGRTRTVSAPLVFVNTGARPTVPDVPGLRDLNPLNSTTVMELAEVPRHLLILGGGYISVEFAQMFRRFGADVTVVQRGGGLLGREDPDVSDAMARMLREDGVEVLLEATTREARRDGEDVVLRVAVDGGEREVRGSHLLVATGRAPNTEALDLARAGVEVDDSGHVKVDEFLHTTAEGVYALGDVKGGPAFTHVSYDDYRVVAGEVLRGEKRSVKDRVAPYTVFTDPQLGRVGLSETQAREAGFEVRVAKLPMSRVARAVEAGQTRGFMKAVVDARTERILGAAVLGMDGGEVASMLGIAMMGGLPYTALRDAMLPHPTLAESLNNLFMTLE
ncbi:mercuric reductase [Deinococcus pimensis]|uniref:mercuric reductase n=1 Tax=Deinococcus pimensis TaxID=309888 RepID=UPI0004864740|nr:mercuric reductase [Deinococcus pimensis]